MNKRSILRFLKNIWLFSFLRRIYLASSYYNKKYVQILKWGFSSREYTNFTYDLTQDNLKYLAHTIALVTKVDYRQVLTYFDEVLNDDMLKKTIHTAIENSSEKKFC